MPGGRACIVLVVAVLAAGCGSGNDSPSLSTPQQKALVAQLEAARATAAAHDVAGTKAAITRFQQSVSKLRQTGALSEQAAHTLRIGAARVLARVKSDNPPPAPQPAATQPTPAPAPAPPGKAKGHKKHEDKHHGKKGKEGD